MNTFTILLSPVRSLFLNAIISERASSSSVIAGVKLVNLVKSLGGRGGGPLRSLEVLVAWDVSEALDDMID